MQYLLTVVGPQKLLTLTEKKKTYTLRGCGKSRVWRTRKRRKSRMKERRKRRKERSMGRNGEIFLLYYKV